MLWSALVLAPLLLSAAAEAQPAAAPTPRIELRLQLSGALNGLLLISHGLDGDNRCGPTGSGALPDLNAMTASGPVETPPGVAPSYDLSAVDGGDTFSLKPVQYEPGLAALDGAGAAVVWLITPDAHRFLPRDPQPGVSLHVTFAPDAASGTIEITGLEAMRNGGPDPDAPRVDARGTWRCIAG